MNPSEIENIRPKMAQYPAAEPLVISVVPTYCFALRPLFAVSDRIIVSSLCSKGGISDKNLCAVDSRQTFFAYATANPN